MRLAILTWLLGCALTIGACTSLHRFIYPTVAMLCMFQGIALTVAGATGLVVQRVIVVSVRALDANRCAVLLEAK